ncbi:MAG: hypothetical protein LBN24_07995 [Mediterranea sp.]|jgi:hypothetical protein|nr:hypothetical protein [Mediterranea sp.]
MKKNILPTKVVTASLLICGVLALSACGNDSNKEIPAEGAFRALTLQLGEEFGSEESTRSLADVQVTRTDLGNGMILEASVVPDGQAATRAAEDVTEGAAVLAIVYNSSTNAVVDTQNLYVTSGKLTLQIPQSEPVAIVFYSYNNTTMPTTSLAVGDIFNASGNRLENEGVHDIIWYKTSDISIGTDAVNLGSIVFSHVFVQVRTELTSTDGSNITAITASLPDAGATSANIDLSSKAVSSQYGTQATSMSTTTGSTATTATSYADMIPKNTASASYTLSITSMTVGGTTVTNKSTNITAAFALGKRYKIKLKVKDGTPSYGIGVFYEWDAKITEPYSTSRNDNTAAEGGGGSAATQSCKDAPSGYLNGLLQHLIRQQLDTKDAFYWDNGSSSLSPSWKDKDGTVRKTGMWIRTSSTSSGNSQGSTSGPAPTAATDAIRQSSNFVFFPAAGHINATTTTFLDVGSVGYYWTSTSIAANRGTALQFTSTYVCLNSVEAWHGALLWHSKWP